MEKETPGVAPLTKREIAALTAMIWGAPATNNLIKEVVIPIIRKYEALLRAGRRPIDPAKAFEAERRKKRQPRLTHTVLTGKGQRVFCRVTPKFIIMKSGVRYERATGAITGSSPARHTSMLGIDAATLEEIL